MIFESLDARSWVIVDALAHAKTALTSDQIRKKVGVDYASATLSRTLSSLGERGFIVKIGSRKSAAYTVPNGLLRAIQRYRKERADAFVDLPVTAALTVEGAVVEQPSTPPVQQQFYRNTGLGRPAFSTQSSRYDENNKLEKGIDDPWFTPDQMRAMTARGSLNAYENGHMQRFYEDLTYSSVQFGYSDNPIEFFDIQAVMSGRKFIPGNIKRHREIGLIQNLAPAITLLRDVVDQFLDSEESGEIIDWREVMTVHGILTKDLLTPQEIATKESFKKDKLIIALMVASRQQDPLEQSLRLLVGITYAQPFSAGNNHLARIICNAPLLAADYPPMTFLGVSADQQDEAMLAFVKTDDYAPMAQLYADCYAATRYRYETR